MNYDKMPAGREMDALVAEKVMGEKVYWKRLQAPWGNGLCLLCAEGENYEHQSVPRYSEYIQDAWVVMEHLWGARRISISYPGRYPGVKTIEVFWATDEPPRYSTAQAGTVPLAICRAALNAIGR